MPAQEASSPAKESDIFQAATQANRRGVQLSELAARFPDVSFNYSGMGDPWTELFGAFDTSRHFDEWQNEIAAYREACN